MNNPIPWLIKELKNPSWTGVSFGNYFINGKDVTEQEYHAYMSQRDGESHQQEHQSEGIANPVRSRKLWDVTRDERRKKMMRFSIKLRNGSLLPVSVKHENDGQVHRYRYYAKDSDGKLISLGNLDVHHEGKSHDYESSRGLTSHLHPEVPRHLRRNGIASSLYVHAAKLAALDGGVLSATDDLSDSASSVWEKLEEDGISKRWSIDRRGKSHRAAIIYALRNGIKVPDRVLEDYPDLLPSDSEDEKASSRSDQSLNIKATGSWPKSPLPWLTKGIDSNGNGQVFGRYYLNHKVVDEASYHAYMDQKKKQSAPKNPGKPVLSAKAPEVVKPTQPTQPTKPVQSADMRHNPDLDDVFGAPVEPKQQPKPQAELRHNPELDDFFGDAQKETPKQQSPKPRDQKPAPGKLLDVRERLDKHNGKSSAAFDELRNEMRSHLAKGGKISLWIDDKKINVKGIEGEKILDDKNQQWGLLPLAMGMPGTKNGIELHGVESSSQPKQEQSKIPQQKTEQLKSHAKVEQQPKPEQQPPQPKPPVNKPPMDWLNEPSDPLTGSAGPRDSKTPPPLPKREDTIPRPKRFRQRGNKTQGVTVGGKHHTVQFHSMEQRKAFEVATALNHPKGTTVGQQQTSKNRAKVKLQQFADKHFGGNVEKAKQYAQAEYKHVTGTLKKPYQGDVAKMGRLPAEYKQLPPPLPKEREAIDTATGKKPGVEPPPLPMKLDNSYGPNGEKLDASFWDEKPQATPEHHQTQSDALDAANKAMETAKGGNRDAMIQAHQAAYDAINKHETAGHKAIEKMAIEKYGYTPKAKQVAASSKKKFSAKLQAARDKIKKASFAIAPPAVPNAPPPLPNESPKFDWSEEKPSSSVDVQNQATAQPTPNETLSQENAAAHIDAQNPQSPLPSPEQQPESQQPQDEFQRQLDGMPSATPAQPQVSNNAQSTEPQKPVDQKPSQTPAATKPSTSTPTPPTSKPTLPPEPKKYVHPHLAEMSAFKDAHPHHQEKLRDVHANHIASSSKTLEKAIHKQNRRIEQVSETGGHPDDIAQEKSIGSLLYGMHDQATKREQAATARKQEEQEKQKAARQQQRKESSNQRKQAQQQQKTDAKIDRDLERKGTRQEKRIPQNKLRYVVRQMGGIDPAHYQKHFGNVQEDLREGGLQSLIRHPRAATPLDPGHRPNGLDEIADELVTSGHIHPPAHMHATDYLIQQLTKDADHEQDWHDNGEYDRYLYQQKQAFEDLQNDPDISESEIAEARRRGEDAGLSQAHSEIAGGTSAEDGAGEQREGQRFRGPEDRADEIEHDAEDFPFGAAHPDYVPPEPTDDFSTFKNDLQESSKPTSADIDEAYRQSQHNEALRLSNRSRGDIPDDESTAPNREIQQEQYQQERDNAYSNSAAKYNRRFKKKSFAVELVDDSPFPWLEASPHVVVPERVPQGPFSWLTKGVDKQGNGVSFGKYFLNHIMVSEAEYNSHRQRDDQRDTKQELAATPPTPKQGPSAKQVNGYLLTMITLEPKELARALAKENDENRTVTFSDLSSQQRHTLLQNFKGADRGDLLRLAMTAHEDDVANQEIRRHVAQYAHGGKPVNFDGKNLGKWLAIVTESGHRDPSSEFHYHRLFDHAETMLGSNIRIISIPKKTNADDLASLFGYDDHGTIAGTFDDQEMMQNVWDDSKAPTLIQDKHVPQQKKGEIHGSALQWESASLPYYKRLTKDLYLRRMDHEFSVVSAQDVSPLVGVKPKDLEQAEHELTDPLPEYNPKEEKKKDKKAVKNSTLRRERQLRQHQKAWNNSPFPWLTKNTKDPNYTGVSFGKYFIAGRSVTKEEYHAYMQQNEDGGKQSQGEVAKPVKSNQAAIDQEIAATAKQLNHPQLEKYLGQQSTRDWLASLNDGQRKTILQKIRNVPDAMWQHFSSQQSASKVTDNSTERPKEMTPQTPTNSTQAFSQSIPYEPLQRYLQRDEVQQWLARLPEQAKQATMQRMQADPEGWYRQMTRQSMNSNADTQPDKPNKTPEEWVQKLRTKKPNRRRTTLNEQQTEASKASVEIDDSVDKASTDALVSKLFPHSSRKESYRRLAQSLGMPDDAKITITNIEERHKLDDGNASTSYARGISIEVSHPALEGTADRFVGIDSKGRRFIKNEYLKIKKDQQNSGLGATIFSKQVEWASRHGFDYIQTHAASGPSFNGFYTWPRFGYDMSLRSRSGIAESDRDVFAEARKKFPDAKTVLDIFKTKEGREWWKENGTDLYRARFDLNPKSRSMQTLQAYIQERKKQKESQPKEKAATTASYQTKTKPPLKPLGNNWTSNSNSNPFMWLS